MYLDRDKYYSYYLPGIENTNLKDSCAQIKEKILTSSKGDKYKIFEFKL